VDTQNERARAFYDRLGFVDAARLLRIDVERLLVG
jgi:ribosomal protein S18 acetylase RimI-like enzyme